MNFLRDIDNRRKAVHCRNFYDDIERPIKNKCAFLFQLCTQRFKVCIFYIFDKIFINIHIF